MYDNSGVMVKDVVCGMLIDLGKPGETAIFHGKKMHFCSVICKKQFEESPEKFERKDSSSQKKS